MKRGWFSKIILTLTGQYLWPISATKIIFKYLVVVWPAMAFPSLSFVQCGEDEVVWEKLPKCANSCRDRPGLKKSKKSCLLLIANDSEGLTLIKTTVSTFWGLLTLRRQQNVLNIPRFDLFSQCFLFCLFSIQFSSFLFLSSVGSVSLAAVRIWNIFQQFAV